MTTATGAAPPLPGMLVRASHVDSHPNQNRQNQSLISRDLVTFPCGLSADWTGRCRVWTSMRLRPNRSQRW